MEGYCLPEDGGELYEVCWLGREGVRKAKTFGLSSEVSKMVGQIFFVRSVFLLEYKNGHLKSHLARCSVDTYITTCMLSETLSFYIFKCFNYALYVLEFLSEYK